QLIAVQRGLLAVEPQRSALLDERDMAPRLRPQLARVVVRLAGPLHSVLRDHVPLLARHLAGLAADAEGCVGEEADPFLRLRPVALDDAAHVFRTSAGSCVGAPFASASACARRPSTNSTSAGPRGRRPGRISQEKAFTSWMCTFGSSTISD